MSKSKILLLGAGNMVSALFSPFETNNSYYEFSVFTPSGSKAEVLANKINGQWIQSLASVNVDEFDFIFLGFKPQGFSEAAKSFFEETGFLKGKKSAVIVSMLAGIPLEVLSQTFQSSKVVRIMPNTPSLEGLGITLISSRNETYNNAIKEILKVASECFVCDSEEQLDEMTAITGSGPAYLFEFARIMSLYLEEKGVSSKDASKLVSQLFLGSSTMMKNSPDSFEVLRNKVTSPKGVTFEALETFKSGGLQGLFVKAFDNNVKRSLELREASLKMKE